MVRKKSYTIQNKYNVNNASQLNVAAALEYVLAHPGDHVNVAELEAACGVGVVITPEQVEQAVERAIQKHKPALLEKR